MSDSRTASRSPAAEPLAERIVEQIRGQVPSFWRERPITDDLRLDDAGLGFDSVGLLELLLACERELGVALPPDLLLDDAMTVGDLIAKLRRAASGH
jgi:acyl carrier protein